MEDDLHFHSYNLTVLIAQEIPRVMSVHNTNTYASATGKVARLLLLQSQLLSRTFLRTVQNHHISLAGTVRAMQILLSTQLTSEELYVSSATSRSVAFTTLATRYHSINRKQPLPFSLASSMALTLARERRSISETSHHQDL
jgi:hypothetical protein